MTNDKLYRCENCDFGTDDEADLDEFKDYWDRIAPGDICPIGDCPKCGAFVHEHSERFRKMAAADDLMAELLECKTHNNANCIVTNDVAYMIRRFRSINKIVDAAIAKVREVS